MNPRFPPECVFEEGIEELYIGLFALAMGGFYLACFALKTSTSSTSMFSVRSIDMVCGG